MRFLSRLKAESSLLLQYLVVVVIFSFMVLISGYFSSRIVTRNITSYGEEVITYSADTLTSYLKAHKATFENVASIVEDLYSRGADADIIGREVTVLADLIQKNDDKYDDLYIYGFIHDDFFQSADRGSEWEEEPSSRPWYVGAYEKNPEVFFSDPYISLNNNDLVMSLSRVLYDKSNISFGILSFDIQFKTINDYVERIRLMNAGYGALLDSDLHVIVHTDKSIFGIKLDELSNENGKFDGLAARLRNGFEFDAFRAISFTGIDSIFFSRRLFNDWHVYMGIPVNDFYHGVNSMLFILSITGFFFMLLLCGILTFMHSSKKRSDEASRLKSSFLANMSHEIRTPMNSIIGMSELLLNSQLPERDMKYVNDINASAHSLLSIINDILDMSKVEAGKMELSPVHYNFHALVDNVVSIFMLVAKKKGLEFRYKNFGEIPEALFGDDIKLRQVLTNICGNAVKFTDSGHIDFIVSILPEQNIIKFEIKDTGIGIRKDDLNILFNAFEQSKTEKNRYIAGTGLGLSISKRFIELMGGSIGLESNYGEGSVFTITIPLVEGNISEIQQNESFSKGYSISAPDAKVLVVDDNEFNLRVAAGLLGLFGINAETSESGKNAVKMVLEKEYDIVFMDHMMPEMDGIEAASAIRAWEKEQQETKSVSFAEDKTHGLPAADRYSRKQIPIIALTANAVYGAKEMFLANGFNGFLSKPIEMPALKKILVEWLPFEKVKHIIKTAADGKEEQDGFWLAISNIEEIDTEIGLHRMDGHKDMYRKYLKLFYEKLKESCDKMTLYMKKGDIENFSIAVHALKSSLASIGAANLSNIALRLETSSKNIDNNYYNYEFPGFLKRLTHLQEQLSDVFPSTDAPLEKEKGSEELFRSIEKALDALDVYDNDAGIEILSKLTAYDFGAETNSLLERALTAFKKYDYDTAGALLKELSGK